MSIFRSGIVKTVRIKCVQAFDQAGCSFKVGEDYDLVLDMGNLFVIKSPAGQDVVVPKTNFKISESKKTPHSSSGSKS